MRIFIAETPKGPGKVALQLNRAGAKHLAVACNGIDKGSAFAAVLC